MESQELQCCTAHSGASQSAGITNSSLWFKAVLSLTSLQVFWITLSFAWSLSLAITAVRWEPIITCSEWSALSATWTSSWLEARWTTCLHWLLRSKPVHFAFLPGWMETTSGSYNKFEESVWCCMPVVWGRRISWIQYQLGLHWWLPGQTRLQSDSLSQKIRNC